MKRLQQTYGSATIMITHDLGVVAEIADDVLVMYAARIAERAPAKVLFEPPEHPYTWGLMRSLPRSGSDGRAPHPDSRAAALAAQPADGLSLPPEVRICVRPLQRRGS